MRSYESRIHNERISLGVFRTFVLSITRIGETLNESVLRIEIVVDINHYTPTLTKSECNCLSDTPLSPPSVILGDYSENNERNTYKWLVISEEYSLRLAQ